MMLAKQSVAATLIIGPILDSTGAEYASAVIGDISLSKNGATLTALASAATLTYIANGQYTLVLTTGNTDTLGRAQFSVNKATYQSPPLELMVVPATVFDALVTNAAGGANGLLLSKASNIADANVISVGPTGANTAQTAFDIGAAIGALNASASSGDPGTTTTLVQYLKQLINTLEGSAGIPTFPAAAAPANAVSLAEIIRSIYTQIGVAGAGLTAADDATIAAIAALNNLSSAQVTAAVPTAAQNAAAAEAAMLNEGDATALLAAIAAKVEAFLINDGDATATLAAIATAVRTNLTTELGRLDAAVSTRLATSGYTAPDNADVLLIKAKTDNLPASPAAVGSAMTLSGDLTSTMKASVTAAVPTAAQNATASRDVNNTSPAANSLGAAVNSAVAPTAAQIDTQLTGTHGSGSWQSGSGGGGGTGANTVTITVTDGSNPLENAKVRMTNGAQSYLVSTDVSGEAVFALDNGTWSVAITNPGYQFAPTTLAVSGDVSHTYAMTQVVITPSDPGQVTGFYTCFDKSGVAVAGALVYVQMQTPPTGFGLAISGEARSEISGDDGVAQFTGLFPGAFYWIAVGAAPKKSKDGFRIPVDATDPVDLNNIVGTT